MVSQRRLTGFARRIAGDGNPLRRRVDKIEAVVLTLLAVIFLIAAPLLAIVAARVAGAAASREQRADAGWTRVRAVLQQNAAAGQVGLDGDWDTSWVRASWTMPPGQQRSGLLPVALNARAGRPVMIWVTRRGQLAHPPVTSSDVRDRKAIAATVTPAGLAVLLTVAAACARFAANRRRMNGWTRDWAATGPRWSSLR